jgi:26S proteasome regulatory subunit T5
MTNDEIITRLSMIDGNIRAMRNEQVRLNHELAKEEKKLQENKEEVKKAKKLPYLISTVVEILDCDNSYMEEGAD